LSKYKEFLKSPEWALTKHYLWNRSKGWCEKCYTSEAKEAHHLTYQYGWNPPLKYLLHVCSDCHDDLTRDQIATKAAKELLIKAEEASQDQTLSDWHRFRFSEIAEAQKRKIERLDWKQWMVD
jgi:hypothetical protein